MSLAVGCGSDQQLGQAITFGNDSVRDLVWSADGSEIFFISGSSVLIGSSSIKAAKTDGSGVRIVDAGHDGYGQLWGPPDGSALYFTAFGFDTTAAEIFEVFQARKITEIAGGVGAFVASPAGGNFAYSDGRTVMLFQPGTGWSSPAPSDGNWWSLAFSPSGDNLCLVSPEEERTVDLAGNVVESTPLALQLNWASAAWAEDGIRILSGENPFPSNYRIQSLSTGADLHIPVTFWTQGFGWSRDARQVAIWGNSCQGFRGFDCSAYQSSLFLVDAVSGRSNEIAHGDDLGQDPVLSPDGARVGYVFGGFIHVSRVP